MPSVTLCSERPKLNGPTLQISAGKRLYSFSEGGSIEVEIKEVDFLRLQVFLELASVRST